MVITIATLLALVGSVVSQQVTSVAPAYQVSDLPRQPELACATTAVEDAVLDCENQLDITHCCSGLDAVYANSSSEAFGCLCLPVVLYETAKRALEYDVDIFGALLHCKHHHPQFSTQWAADQHTACPSMLLQGDLMDRLRRMGSVPLLSADAPNWAWRNLLQAQHFVQKHPAGSQAMVALTDYVLGRLLSLFMMLSLLSATLLFFLVHNCVLTKASTVYKALPVEQQLVTCQHAVYVAAYALTIIPQTWLAAELLFKAWTGNDLVKRTSTILIGLATGRAALFTVEACVRSVKWSWLLFCHHALNMLTTTINMWDGSPVLAAIGAVLDLFTAHELPLYVVLLAYRLEFWPRVVTRTFLRVACAWFAATRVLQTVMLAYMFSNFVTVPSIKSTPAFVFTAVLCTAFTVLQSYTLLIYQSMDRKLGKAGHSISRKGGVLEKLAASTAPQQHTGLKAASVQQHKAHELEASSFNSGLAKDQGGQLSEPLVCTS